MVQPNLSGKGKYTPPQEMVGRGVKIECKALIDHVGMCCESFEGVNAEAGALEKPHNAAPRAELV